VLRVLGGGGMGIVLLARDAKSQRDVAVKLVRSDLVNNQSVVHRFRNLFAFGSRTTGS